MEKSKYNLRSSVQPDKYSKSATLQYKQNKKKEWYWTLKARNGKQFASSLPETYKNRADCVKNATDILFLKWKIEE